MRRVDWLEYCNIAAQGLLYGLYWSEYYADFERYSVVHL
jgi:hypothetical protein